jgi:acyl-coenzyme A thioesterase PaaI-like protein
MTEQEERAIAALRERGLTIPLAAADRRPWQENFNQLPGMRMIRGAIDLSDEVCVAVHLPEIGPEHQGGLGADAVNGAVLAGCFDVALGVAGVLQFPGRRAGTVELSMKFMRPAVGGTVTAWAVALKRADNIAFVESELFCGGRFCARASGMVATATGGS